MRVAPCLVTITIAIAARAHAAPCKHEPSALVLVIDRSGSMQGPKLDAAKAAALAAVDALDPSDQISVIAFDSDPQTLVLPKRAGDRVAITKEMALLVAGGGTNFLPALQAAIDLFHDPKLAKIKTKHVVLLSDGQAPTDGVVELVQSAEATDITVSSIGLGTEIDRDLMGKIALAGAGRLYVVDDPKTLPKIFVKEVKRALR